MKKKTTNYRCLGAETPAQARKRLRFKQSQKIAESDPGKADLAEQMLEVMAQLRAPSQDQGVIAFTDVIPNGEQKKREHLESIGLEFQDLVVPLLLKWREAREALAVFREKKGIERPVDLPDDRSKQLGVIVLILTLEVILAGIGFSRGAESIILGMWPALGPAFVVGVLGFLIAQCLRQLAQRDWKFKIAGGSGAAVCIAIALFSLLSSAHLRDAPDALNGGLATAAGAKSFVAGILADPWGLSALSWWLFLFGVAGLAVVIYEWMASDDPHPGYGRLARKVESARAEVDRAIRGIHERIEASIHGIAARTEETVWNNRRALGECVAVGRIGLHRLGIVDPATREPTDSDPPWLVTSLQIWRETCRWHEDLHALGDVRTALVKREGVDSDELFAVERLSQARTVDEASDWLASQLSEYAWQPRSDEEAATYA